MTAPPEGARREGGASSVHAAYARPIPLPVLQCDLCIKWSCFRPLHYALPCSTSHSSPSTAPPSYYWLDGCAVTLSINTTLMSSDDCGVGCQVPSASTDPPSPLLLLARGGVARLSLSAVRLLLPLILVLLPFLPAASSAAIWCGLPLNPTAVPPSPTTRLPAVALSHLNSSGYDQYSCTFTFSEFESAHSDWVTCYHAPTVNVHTCPRDCLRSVDTAPHSARVIGSKPFHGNSAICLAAIHAGVINSSEGGAVHVDRFYPADWSMSDSQTLYPEGAAQGSERHGVRSVDVPLPEVVTPAAESSYSWSVRPRGLVPRQVQQAPFSPRTGHVHAWLYPQLQIRASWSTSPRCWRHTECAEFSLNYTLHFIIGGKNATHYLNDVGAHNPKLQLSICCAVAAPVFTHRGRGVWRPSGCPLCDSGVAVPLPHRLGVERLQRCQPTQ